MHRMQPQLQLSHGTWLAGTQSTTIFYTTDRLGGTFGVTGRYVALQGLEYRTDIPTDDPLATFDSYGAFLQAQYARSRNNIRWGIGVKAVNMYISAFHTRGLALDVGLIQSLGKELKVGISLLNLGTFSSWEGRQARFPRRLSVGVEKSWEASLFRPVLLASLESTTQTKGIIARLGGQVQWKQLILNLGYEHSDGVQSLSSGLGIRTGRYAIQYGFRFGSQDLTMPQVLDIAITLP